jgi:hypothetical protein
MNKIVKILKEYKDSEVQEELNRLNPSFPLKN